MNDWRISSGRSTISRKIYREAAAVICDACSSRWWWWWDSHVIENEINYRPETTRLLAISFTSSSSIIKGKKEKKGFRAYFKLFFLIPAHEERRDYKNRRPNNISCVRFLHFQLRDFRPWWSCQIAFLENHLLQQPLFFIHSHVIIIYLNKENRN
jgi:hypothetical protein